MLLFELVVGGFAITSSTIYFSLALLVGALLNLFVSGVSVQIQLALKFTMLAL